MDHRKKNPSYEKRLVIRQMQKAKDPSRKDLSQDIKGICCMSYPSKIKLSLDKNTYDANETATIRVRMDNSNCQLDCQNINLGIKQVFSIKFGAH